MVDVPHDITSRLLALMQDMQAQQEKYKPLLDSIHPRQLASALNLMHYLRLRQLDLAGLQEMLHKNGLSTLSYAEGYIQSQLQCVMQHLPTGNDACNPPVHYDAAKKIHAERVQQLFGNWGEEGPSIMVTFKTSFAHDFITVKKLMKAGMNVARINCAHDHEKTWLQMVKTVREVSQFTGLPCRIYMDLAGPKIRTRIRAKKKLELEEGDNLLLTDRDDLKDKMPVVSCTIPQLTQKLKPGERVLFDDGLIETRVIQVRPEAAELEVVQVSSRKPFLKTEKGINFPDSDIQLVALTAADRRNISFIMEHADMVGYSFVQRPADVRELQMLVHRRLPVIIKVETPAAYRHLPGILLAAMQEEYYGVMVARGDLAVELGFENIGQAQEEILSLCRAAHAPVIFATQVLENMNKKGLPTRAEITDAALGLFADCIMLNKGDYTARVLKTLKQVLSRKALQYNRHYPVFRPLEMECVQLAAS